MDTISRSFYELSFRVAFLEKRADEFQDFFSSIMEKSYPADFVRVKPWGNVGDRKNDGYLRSHRILFQCFAPNEMKAADCIAKIDEDFCGALPYWKEHFDTWVFVHNARDGLGPDVTKKLLDLNAHPNVSVTHWGFEELRKQVFLLSEDDLASLFGPAPTRQSMIDLPLSELEPVLEHIATLPPTPDPDLRPIPAGKVERNLLSDSVAVLLRAGMSRSDLVAKYFRVQPVKQDQIAESFRAEYRRLRALATSPDEVFRGLQRFAGGDTVLPPARLSAVLAVLAFFFEACDIFERPEEEEFP